jgi:hypothetical protein
MPFFFYYCDDALFFVFVFVVCRGDCGGQFVLWLSFVLPWWGVSVRVLKFGVGLKFEGGRNKVIGILLVDYFLDT